MADSKPELLPEDAKPPKSKSAAYYAIHPKWQDIAPIPQKDQTGALAAIAYSPRYSEAMAYLRAVMAANEFSERTLALTEDLISINPAHYTVWIYRMRILQALWDAKNTNQIDHVEHSQSVHAEVDDAIWSNVEQEIIWLDDVSFRNLKNYQIWHHRQSLTSLLPKDAACLDIDTPKPQDDSSENLPSLAAPVRERVARFLASEQKFLAEILSLDTKNYHVWSYRQWLCQRYPSFLLPAYGNPTTATHNTRLQTVVPGYRQHAEVAAMDLMIADDVYNNSAWSHRYFVLFGYSELSYALRQTPPLILKQVNAEKLLHKANLVDQQLVEAEIAYTQDRIREAPQNASTWNYLRGVIKHGDIAMSTLRSFCEEFLGPEKDLWADQWIEVEIENSETGEKSSEPQEIGVRSSRAIEWLAEICAGTGSEEDHKLANECYKALSEKWDPIRQGYWAYRRTELGLSDKM